MLCSRSLAGPEIAADCDSAARASARANVSMSHILWPGPIRIGSSWPWSSRAMLAARRASLLPVSLPCSGELPFLPKPPTGSISELGQGPRGQFPWSEPSSASVGTDRRN